NRILPGGLRTAMQSTPYSMHESQEYPTLPISTATGGNFFPNQLHQLEFEVNSFLPGGYNGNNAHYSPEIYEFGFPTSYDCYGSYTGSSSLTTDTEKEKETEVRMVKGNPKKARTPRTIYSSLQLCVLQSRFRIRQYLALPERAEIAASLGLTQTQVKIWFQNRRSKLKKLWRNGQMPPGQQETPCDSTRSSSSPRPTAVHWGPQNHRITEISKEWDFMPPNTSAPSFYSNYSWYSSDCGTLPAESRTTSAI
uniref:Distal-less homeobox 2b n=1 Tax=Oncorhynchus kisutch TaxID=8019 RepID=A0A8C7LFC9_ONCKI